MIKNKEVFETSVDNIIRDFITPPDFYCLIQAIIDYDSTNMVLDCYTKSSVSKFNLLNELKSGFGLEYEVEEDINIVNATGIKSNYYSLNKAAKSINYNPKNSSLDGIIQEINLTLGR